MVAQWDALQEAASAAKEARNAMEDAEKRLASGVGGFKAPDGEFERMADAVFGPYVDRAYAAGRGDGLATDTDTSARGKAVADVVVAVTDRKKEIPVMGRDLWDAVEGRMADVVRDHLQAAHERGKKDGLTSAQAK